MTTHLPIHSAIHHLQTLVGFPTVSADSNLALIDWVEGYVSERGARCRRTYDDSGQKANLWVTFGPDEDGGVVWSGHTDVVPVTGQDWHSDPFTLTERDGRLYGRGSCDMKGFLAVMLAAVAELDVAKLKRPLHLAFSYDEEVGCLGVDRMVDDAIANGPKPSWAVIGEPTMMEVVLAHKSINVFNTRVTGRAAHSSLPHHGAGAIFAAARIIEHLRQLGVDARQQAAPEGEGFEPGWTTVQVGRIDGGTAVNILPALCEFMWEYRALPSEDPDRIMKAVQAYIDAEVRPALQEFAPEADVHTETIARVPPLLAQAEHAVEPWIRQFPGVGTAPAGQVSFATEGGSFQRAGMATVVCGPGSIDVAHQPNEWVKPEQLQRSQSMLAGIIEWASR
jgi:acetylornithine deacetylase